MRPVNLKSFFVFPFASSSNLTSTLPRNTKKLPFALQAIKSLVFPNSGLKLHLHVDKLHEKFGKIFAENVGPIDCVFVSCPQAMRKVFAHEGKHPKHVLPEAWTLYLKNNQEKNQRGLFFMDDEEWSRYRKLLNGVFLKSAPDLNENLEKCCRITAEQLHDDFLSSSKDRIEDFMFSWSLTTLIAILIGHESDFDKWFSELSAQIQNLALTNQKVFETSACLQLTSSKLAAKFNLPSWKRFENAVDTSLNSSKNLVLTLLGGNGKYVHNSGILHRLLLDDQISVDNLVRVITDLVLAAGDTTSYSMQWLLYCLGKNPHIQEEIRKVSSSSEKNAADLLIKNCIKESLRLYPTAPFLTRFLPEDLDLLGHKIGKNSLIVMSIYTSGRSEEFFKDAALFDPHRWDRKDNNFVASSSWGSLPFAMGKRSCVGKKIAEMQMKSVVKQILSGHKIVVRNKKEVEFVMRMVGVPSEPIELAFEPLSS